MKTINTLGPSLLITFAVLSSCTPKSNPIIFPGDPLGRTPNTALPTGAPINQSGNTQAPIPSTAPTQASSPSTSIPTQASSRPVTPTWRKTSSGQAFIRDLDFVDTKHGYMVGDKGAILATDNAGLSWTSQQKGSSTLNAISFVDVNTGWVAGDGGVIFHTIDAGKTWAIQDSGVITDIKDIRFTDAQTGYITSGEMNNVHKTVDGGTNWTQIASIQAPEYLFLNQNKQMFGSSRSMVYKLNGDTWSKTANLQTCGGSGINQINFAFNNESNGFAYEGYVLYQTTDGGNSWQPLNKFITDEKVFQECDFQIDAMGFSSETNGFAIISVYPYGFDSHFMYKTTDGGKTWMKSGMKAPEFTKSGKFVVTAPNSAWLVDQSLGTVYSLSTL